MRWVEHVEYVGKMHTKDRLEFLKESDHLEELGVDGNITLTAWKGFIWLWTGKTGGLL